MGHQDHRARAPRRVGVALVTVSSSRSAAEDRSGPRMAELVASSGHEVVAHELVSDAIEPIRACLEDLGGREGVRAVFLSGGTGVAQQDVTVEAVGPKIEAWLPGFGEIFRQLSFEEIGPAAMLSRACAGVARLAGRRVLVACLPGSPGAVELALERLLLPELGHVIYEMER
ncbi:MAG: MogA/MoaB family molybdenum cofactor biosynthesis protein [Deltaproteobacteria bacterium]|nr:MogA/MoaB family molybdenum cofactor biosynthesis protein [Deltaproteobacteria bacterium]